MSPGCRKVVGCEGTPGQGQFIGLVIKYESGKIRDASYMAYPCPVAHSCANFAVEFVEGKTVGEARVLDEAAIVAALGHMPLGREHCPGLAIKALKHALDQLDGSTN